MLALAPRLQLPDLHAGRVSKWTITGLQMANVSPAGTVRGLWTTKLQVKALIADLSQSIDLLTVDIEFEEERTGVHDVSEPTYPVLGRSLRARRENLEATIASLQKVVHGVPKAAA